MTGSRALLTEVGSRILVVGSGALGSRKLVVRSGALFSEVEWTIIVVGSGVLL